MLSTFLMLLGLVILAALAYAFTRPDNFIYSRTARINAPPERIYPLIADLRQMNAWNPFAKPDPNIKFVYSGPESGIGAINDFSGNNQVGAGRVEITDAAPPSRVTMRLVMTRPLACDNTVEFTLVPVGSTTDVTWAMSGKSNLLSKLMCLAMDPDKMVGGMFEKGLADLKVLAEK